METTSRAYGKLILAGEHAVVYGVPAIAVGIDRGARAVARPASVSRLRIGKWSVDVAENGEGDLARAFSALVASARTRGSVASVEVDASTELPPGGGLGCSAALGVAVARAVSPDASDEEILVDAMAWEKIFHGNPSGVDAAVATLGGVIQFVRGVSSTSRRPAFGGSGDIESVEASARLFFVIGHSGTASSTKTMVEGLARLREAEPAMVSAAFERIRTISGDVRAAIECGDLAALGAALDENQAILATLSLSTPVIDAMCTLARRTGALGCKLTGAGGGGCVVALAQDRACAERVLYAWGAGRRFGFVTELGVPRRDIRRAPASDSLTAL